ncbi:Type II secretion system protein F [Pirellulimonas nuda]|uniref:Type II secretion system protein F n=1 Tax=Pirellulimonas nuda TaxID=2528009 RepID=A0A518DCM2_9BACT|nr:type II secretion system F family protein [Pirellulimonas nuda]QDU89176.1 Type II secretion system protein F [Pirellulimonas nuda]
MPHFRYQAIDDASQPISGVVEHSSLSAAIARLEGEGLKILAISQALDDDDLSNRGASTVPDGLTEAIARVFHRREELLPPLRAYAAEMPPGRCRRDLEKTLAVVADGDPVSARESFVALPGAWCPLLAAAASTSGPAEALSRFAEDSRRVGEIRSQSWWRLAYPATIAVVAVAVLVLISMFIVPTFRDVFDSFGLRRPAITQLLLAVSSWILSWHAIFTAGAAAVVLLVLHALYRRAPGKLTARLELLAPFRLGQQLAIGRLAQFTSDLVEAGIAAPEALRLAGKAAGRRSIAYATEQGRANPAATGHTLAYALSDGITASARVALLREVSSSSSDRARFQTRWAHGLAGPLAVVALGLLVGFVVLSLFAPLVMLIEGLS